MTEKWLHNTIATLHNDGYRWARQCCQHNEELAKDVMQEVYVKMWSGKARFNEKSSVKTWFFAVIRNTARSLMNQQKPVDSLDNLPDSLSIVVDEQRDYQSILATLSDKQAQVMLLVFYHNHTLEEVAEIMDLGVGTVRTHYDRGKKNLKDILKKEHYEG